MQIACPRRLRALCLTVFVAALIGLVGPVAAGAGSDAGKLRVAGLDAAVAVHLDATLQDLERRAAELRAVGLPNSPEQIAAGSKRLGDAIAARALRLDGGGAVQVDVTLDGDGPAPALLAALGVVVEHHRPDLGRAQYRVPASVLANVAVLPGVRFLALPTYGRSATGSRLSEGDAALRADQLRSTRGLGGDGVRVGVIADGIDGITQSQASGDAPQISPQQAFSSRGIADGAEGTAMIEIVHDLAPGASIGFANAATDLDMMEAVNFLAANSDIVVDDLGFFFPDDQQSAISRNTAAALNNPAWPIRAYFTSVGNWARRHYSGQFLPGPNGRTTLGLDFDGAVHQFSAGAGTSDAQGRGTSTSNELFLDTGDFVDAVLFWDDPWGGSTNDYDLYLLDPAGNIVEFSVAGQGSFVGTPRERFVYQNDGPPGFFRLVVQNFEDRAQRRTLELFVFDAPRLPGADTTLNFNTRASSMLAQSDAGGGVISLGALVVDDPALDAIRPYSSEGPTNNGVTKPDAASVDGVSVTGNGGFPSTFFGTSAAAPHAAALTALLLEARPSLLAAPGDSAAQERASLRSILLASAIDLGAPGTDNVFGAGRLDAIAAVDEAVQNRVTVSTDADAGPGSLRNAIDSVNSAAAAGATSNSIEFDAPRTILLQAPLPALSASDVFIEGAGTVIDGVALAGGDGLVISGADVSLNALTLRAFDGAGLYIAGAARIDLTNVRVDGNGVGLLVDGGAQDVGAGGDAATGIVAVNNLTDGVRISGAGTAGVRLRSSFIGVEADGTVASNGGNGVLIDGGASDNVIGAALGDASTIVTATVVTAQAPELSQTIIGTVSINGLPAPVGMLVEAFLDGFPVAATSVGLVVLPNVPLGFVLTVTGPGDLVTFAVDGEFLDVEVPFEPGAVTTVTLTVAGAGSQTLVLAGGNVIAHNGGNGIRVAGTDSLRNTIRGNAVHSNAALDIDLVSPTDPASGATRDDPGDADTGPNGLLNRARLSSVQFSAGLATVAGSAPAGGVVDLYAAEDPGTAPLVSVSPAAVGGAVRFLGSAAVVSGVFVADGVAVGSATALTALVTDSAGNTSEFSVNFNLGPGPQITRISPDTGSVNGGTTVRVTGTGFGGGAGLQVLFGGVPASIVSAGATDLTVITPAGALGTVPVVVVNPDGRAAVFDGVFTYAALQSVSLRPGWNNVTWAGPPTTVTVAIAPLAGRVDRVFAWDPETQRFSSFIVGAPAVVNSLTTLQPGQVLWVFVLGSTEIVWEQPLSSF